QNLLDPGKTPHENEQFLLFLSAVIQAVDEYSDILRASAANTGNDHRLGANEAPPAIISVYLGEQLADIFAQLEENGGADHSKSGGELKVGVTTLPTLRKDSTDRNRTSPFAFTGNKFEFRMVPSSASIATPNTTLNTIVAETLSRIADRLEKAKDIDAEVPKIIKEIVKDHKRIIFNGNNYSEEWLKEAEKRGLPNIRSTVEAVKVWGSPKAITLFEKHHVLSKVELHSHYEIYLENYSKQINIEALTMLDMAKRQILPAILKYTGEVAQSLNQIKTASAKANVVAFEDLLHTLTETTAAFNRNLTALEKALNEAEKENEDSLKIAEYFRDVVFAAMGRLRVEADRLETMVDAKVWPFPTYADMLFNV
ncbi:MAG TPA: glutamine synthetase type III, partial [Bacillota bacterium]